MNTHRDPKELAEDLLPRSPCEIQVAAVLSDSYGIFSWGWNHSRGRIGVHAEYHAILRSNRERLEGAKLTILGRYQRNDNPVLSFPCVGAKKHSRSGSRPCFELVLKHKIGAIEFRTKSGKWIYAKLLYVPYPKGFYCEEDQMICPVNLFSNPAFIKDLIKTPPERMLIPVLGGG